jgi:hypothetical protein
VTPADELRAAADKIRKLAGQADDGPWETTWRQQQYHLDGYRDGDLHPISEWTYAIATWEPQATEQRAECDTANADYIAAMHPGVGKVLAEWLENAAHHYECGIQAADDVFRDDPAGREAFLTTGPGAPSSHALAVARAINGTEQPATGA